MAVFYTAPWCHHCTIMKPIIQELKAEGYDIEITEKIPKHIKKLPTLEVNNKLYPGVHTKEQYKEILDGSNRNK